MDSFLITLLKVAFMLLALGIILLYRAKTGLERWTGLKYIVILLVVFVLESYRYKSSVITSTLAIMYLFFLFIDMRFMGGKIR